MRVPGVNRNQHSRSRPNFGFLESPRTPGSLNHTEDTGLTKQPRTPASRSKSEYGFSDVQECGYFSYPELLVPGFNRNSGFEESTRTPGSHSHTENSAFLESQCDSWFPQSFKTAGSRCQREDSFFPYLPDNHGFPRIPAGLTVPGVIRRIAKYRNQANLFREHIQCRSRFEAARGSGP